MSLINREDLIAEYDRVHVGPPGGARKLMVNAPEVLPEIIRCKDCKHWREGITYSYCDKLYGMGVLDIYDYMTSEDDFCSRAERRPDGVDS